MTERTGFVIRLILALCLQRSALALCAVDPANHIGLATVIWVHRIKLLLLEMNLCSFLRI